MQKICGDMGAVVVENEEEATHIVALDARPFLKFSKNKKSAFLLV